MGGPGVSLLVCRDHLDEAALELRRIRASLSGDASKEGPALSEVIDKLVDARQCLVELREERLIYGALDEEPEQLPYESFQAETKDAESLWMRMMVAGADKGFRSLDTFVGWFVAGTGAVMGLLLANLDKLTPYLQHVDLGSVIRRVVIAFGLVVVAKFLGSLICTAAGAASEAESILEARLKRGAPTPSVAAIFSAKKSGTPRVLQFLGRIIGGDDDPATLSRRITSALAAAGFLSLLAAGFVGSALDDLSTKADFRHGEKSHVTSEVRSAQPSARGQTTPKTK